MQENYEEMFEWYKKSAEVGFDWGMVSLANCYEYRIGVERDCEKARELYQKAIDCHGEAEETARKLLNEL